MDLKIDEIYDPLVATVDGTLGIHDRPIRQGTRSDLVLTADSADYDGIYFQLKRAFDIFFALAVSPLFLLAAPLVFLLNIQANKGPLLFAQVRMGRNGCPFTLYKFRTMVPADTATRGFDDPLEVDRITPFGAWLRRTRVDELPQVINILRGDMSVVGPRPDAWGHAVAYCDLIPGYRQRHVVRPGLTGLAQIRIGYVEGVSATRRKARADLAYIANMNVTLDLFILISTLRTVGR